MMFAPQRAYCRSPEAANPRSKNSAVAPATAVNWERGSNRSSGAGREFSWRRVEPFNCSAFAEATGATSKALHREAFDFLGAHFSTRSVVCWNGTLRSSSPWTNSTGDRTARDADAGSEFIERQAGYDAHAAQASSDFHVQLF